MQFSYKSVCQSILIQMGVKTSLKVNFQKIWPEWPPHGLMPRIGQRHFGSHAPHGHNLAIFHPILTIEYTKMTSLSRRIK